jgi:hypothetical protein
MIKLIHDDVEHGVFVYKDVASTVRKLRRGFGMIEQSIWAKDIHAVSERQW